jgi:LPS-assembly protein
MRVSYLSKALALLILLFATSTAGQEEITSLKSDGEINVDAAEISYDRKADQVVARGNVVIRRGETELRADEVRIDRPSNQAEALGNVQLITPDGVIDADRAYIDLDSETGALRNAYVHSQEHRYSLFGTHIGKGIGQTYHIEDGRFTTCDCGDRAPDWSISGEELDVTLRGYAKLRGGTFNVLDVPVLYVPVAWFPANLERQSGFLSPRFGASNRRGFQTVLPFYWAINKSHDLTIAGDVETSARAGVIGEYRYALSPQTDGIIGASYFNESLGESGGVDLDSSIPENRWSVAAQHRQGGIADSFGYVDGLIVSDDAFLRQINTFAFDYEADVKLRTLPYTESTVGIVRMWDPALLKMEAKYYQDLDAQGELNSQTLQRAPQLSLLAQRSVGDYIIGEFESSFDNYQRSAGAAGMRLDLRPGFSLPLPLGRYAFGSVRTAFRETAYYLTETELSRSDPTMLDRDQTRETVEVTARVGSAVTRVYDVQRWGLDRVQHTIEPAFEYLYLPSVSQDDAPFFDYADRLNRRNLVTYGVASRFLGKFSSTAADETEGPDDVRELGRVWLAQSYDISGRIARVDDTEQETTADHFSDIDLGGRVSPTRDFSLRFRTQYDAKNTEISAANVGFFVVDPRDYLGPQNFHELANRTSLGMSYRFLTANRLQEINSSVVIRLTDWLGFIYASRVDLNESEFLDNHFGLRFVSTCDCWAFEVAVTDRTNPNEIEARAQLTLLGLGSFGGSSSDEGVARRLP